MTMTKISFTQLSSNLASANLAILSNDGEVKGEAFFVEKMQKLREFCKPEKSISVAFMVLNAYQWGQEYQESINNQEVRRPTK